MNKIIGIDIDGVITREGDEKNNIWHNALCEYFGEELERKNDVFNFIDAYELSKTEIENFINDNIEDIYKTVKPAKGAKETINFLKKYNFEILLITARHHNFKNLTKNWLKQYNIPYDTLIHEENKAPLAIEKNIKLFIEDNKKNAIKLLKNNIAVIIMDRYHNRSLKNNDKLYRAENWVDIKKYIINYFDMNISKTNKS